MNQFNERYNRQLILDGFGEKAQRLLGDAKVLVVGAGGLGCPALLYLTAAGIGTIGIIDHDTVTLSNLHRQVLFSTEDIGLLKAEAATRKLRALNPGASINPYPFQLDPLNAAELIGHYDYVIDGSDNFSTRYLVNDTCVLLGKPLVYGAVSTYEGQVAVFSDACNYRDLFPEQPGDHEFASCAEAGVLGVLPGMIGTMQATELIKLVTGIGQPLVNRLLTYNALTQQIFTIHIKPAPKHSYRLPSDAAAIAVTDYGDGCRSVPANLIADSVVQINAEALKHLTDKPDTRLIDVREPGETPALPGYQYTQIALSVFPSFAAGIEANTVILFCQSGSRSLKAATLLKQINPAIHVYSLEGGIMAINPDHA